MPPNFPGRLDMHQSFDGDAGGEPGPYPDTWKFYIMNKGFLLTRDQILSCDPTLGFVYRSSDRGFRGYAVGGIILPQHIQDFLEQLGEINGRPNGLSLIMDAVIRVHRTLKGLDPEDGDYGSRRSESPETSGGPAYGENYQAPRTTEEYMARYGLRHPSEYEDQTREMEKRFGPQHTW